jgi:hypothetical protein
MQNFMMFLFKNTSVNMCYLGSVNGEWRSIKGHLKTKSRKTSQNHVKFEENNPKIVLTKIQIPWQRTNSAAQFEIALAMENIGP